MPYKRYFRFLAASTLLILVVALAATIPGVSAGGDDDAEIPPEKTESKYPNLGSQLNRMVTDVQEGRTTASEAAEGAAIFSDESVAVTIHLSSHVDEVVTFLEDNGGDPRNVGDDYIEAYVPVSLLGPVSERPGVLRVREIIPPQPTQLSQRVIGNGPAVHGSQAWNAAGYSGQGVKVGIIDDFLGFSALRGIEVPSTVVVRCYTDIGVYTNDLADCDQEPEVTSPWPECLDALQSRARIGASHGTIVAESLLDIAPGVTLYIANPPTRGDTQEAVDWMASQGVQVISYSLGWIFDGPGDGTSPESASPLNTVDRAVENDILWVSSAGNFARDTWFGGYSDPDRDGNIAFGGTNDEVIDMPVRACSGYVVQLRWEDDWSGARTDLDLYLYDKTNNEVLLSSDDLQSGGSDHVPWEAIVFRTRTGGNDLGIAVRHFSGEAPEWVQVLAWTSDDIEHYTANGSITNPAESGNSGLLAVGAAPWFDVNTIESFSSQGPAPDGRPKPEVVAADCGATALIPLRPSNRGFCGTSQAAPHVAGLAALVRQRFPAYTPVQVAAYLKNHAQQRENPDPNNTWGHGFAKLPSPDRAALTALYDATGGANWTNNTNWLTNAPIGQWHGVTTDANGRVTSLDITRNQLTGPIPAELGSLTSLEILALGGNQLTGPIPTWLGNLTNLEEVYLWGNPLTGQIPSQLASLTNLRELHLSSNQLTGTIPTWLGSLANLEGLWLGDNQLSGEIPSELGSLANLRELDIGDNQLTGTIPTELGSLANLEELWLSGNQLTGEVPSWLGSLANLEGLWLGDNQLSGEIPSELGSLANLRELDIGTTS